MAELIWDIQEQHLDEAEFLLEMLCSCVDSPRYTLASLRAGPERRLLAHLDGLRVGAERVVEELLLPVFADAEDADEDEFRTGAAALAVLEGAGLEACEAILVAHDRAWAGGDLRARRGLLRALSLSRRAGLYRWLARDLDALEAGPLAGRLRALAAHRVNAGVRVQGWLEAEDLELRRAAALLARHTAAPEALRSLHRWMDHEDRQLRWLAVESGLIRGQWAAWSRAVELAFAADSDGDADLSGRALAWVAMLGDAAIHERLFAELAAAPSPARLWAAGLSGRPTAIAAAVELLDHAELARLAGELLCAVAGLPADDDQFWLDRGRRVGVNSAEALPRFEADELDADLVPAGADHLRLPDPEAVRFWWAQRRDRFDPSLRYTAGRPLELASVARSLAELPTRRRHPLALELAGRSSGRAQLETRALAQTQLAQGQELFSRLAHLDFQTGLTASP